MFTGVTEDGVFSSVLTSAGLKDLLHTLDPRYPVPGRASIHKELDKILIKLKAKMSVHVQSACPMQSVSAVTSGPRRGYLPPILELLRTFFSRCDRRRHIVTLAVRRLTSSHTLLKIECQTQHR